MNKKLNANGLQLSNQLAAVKLSSSNESKGRLINVAGVGGVVSVAYEQLRNAAEYAQEHLLIQNAIRRFFVRSLSFHNHTTVRKTISEDLIIELTQSGYIKNNSQSSEVITKLKHVIHKHYNNYWRLKAAGIDDHKVHDWTLDLLSIESETILVEDTIQTIYLQFAYHHYSAIIQKKLFVSNDSEDSGYDVSLYISVHRALLKSDLAAVRYDMQKLYDVSDSNINEYAKFHENIDEVFASDQTNKITLYINKYGAPLRILRSMITDNDKASEILVDSEVFDKTYASQIKQEYRRAESKLNRGLVKSIAFLLITKALIGVAIEVPYDLITTREIAWLPLIVNLLTPIIYMALIRFGFNMPGTANAKAIRRYADDMLYGDQSQVSLYPTARKKSYPIGFSIAYALMFLIVFSMVTYLLFIIGFSIVQGVMFFVFLAAASFLGFRLSRIVRELELITVKPGAITTIRDFLFTPFTFLGKWLSEKYQKVNVVALILDTFIELPLKTVLRLLRQWTGFLDDKKDEI
ncbi:MAG: hypothetical protein WCK26_01860 [Candidatus Saccharibacteria bacterium]